MEEIKENNDNGEWDGVIEVERVSWNFLIFIGCL